MRRRAAREAWRAAAAGAAVLGVLVAAAPLPARATYVPSGPPIARAAATAAAYRQAQADLSATQARLTSVDGRLQAADDRLAAAQAKAAADLQREQALRAQVGAMARSAYQLEGSQLSAILEASSIGQLLDSLAEARVVHERQHAALDQLTRLREADESQRDAASAQRDALARLRDQLSGAVSALVQRVSGLTSAIMSDGEVLAGAAGHVPAGNLPQTTGIPGQCTWYAEQAWATYSDPTSPAMTGNGGQVVPNLAAAMNRPVELQPTPGALVSWKAPLLSAYGHVAYVAAVDRTAGGALTGYTVWEMNYTGPFQTDVRHVTWTGPNAGVVFLSPPAPVNPILAAAASG